jgi:Ca2+-binding RTX toxin-like protein
MPLTFDTALGSPFQSAQKAYVVDIATGDLNQDAQVDLVIIRYDYAQRYFFDQNRDQPIIEMLQGKGDGTFTSSQVSPLGISLALADIVKAADFNQDGKIDLLVSGEEVQKSANGTPVAASRSTATWALMLGDGSGSFTPTAPVKVNDTRPYSGSLNTQAVDLNRDGYLDIIAHQYGDVGYVWLGRGGGIFESAIALETILSDQPTSPVNNITPVDINGDGQLDLIINHDVLKDDRLIPRRVERTVYFNTGNINGIPRFQRQVNASSIIGSNVYERELVGDVNRDQKVDILLSENALLGDGNGNFSNPQPYVPYNSRLTTDFNQDGNPDIVSLGLGQKSFRADILLGDGKGRFSIPERYIIGAWEAKATPTGPMTIADVNGDGKPDLIGIDPEQKTANVYLNRGAGRSAVILNRNRLNASGARGQLNLNLKQKRYTLGREQGKTPGITDVIGTRKSDRLTGDDQRNILLGSDGNDVINGLGNDDLIIGGIGNDRLTGGSGHDRFQLGSYRPELRQRRYGLGNTVPETPYKRKYGHDIITDFEVKADKLEITSSWFDTYTPDQKGEYTFSFKAAPDEAAAKRSSALIVYVVKTGSLYYNPNRSVKGFAQGGLIADLTDGLEINRNHFITETEDRPTLYSR